MVAEEFHDTGIRDGTTQASMVFKKATELKIVEVTAELSIRKQ
jgi:hypothetical protein